MTVPSTGPRGAKDKQPNEPEARLRRSAIGLEAEFTTKVDGVHRAPEQVFRDPRDFLSGAAVHRVGTSYHLPNGGAVYFDTGVIEMVTPAIELERGAAVRVTRSLWENIARVREDLDGWERRTGRRVQLGGFSTHYNVSIDAPAGRPLDDLARLLTYVLPAPVMLLAASRRSTGIGVRPRVTRLEVTVDFTPDAGLQVATATLIAAVVRSVARWPEWSLAEMRRRALPVIAGFAPQPHTSRKGWLAKDVCYPVNPFTTPPGDPVWVTAAQGPASSLRGVAQRVFDRFRLPIARLADPFTLRLIPSILAGSSTSLLDLPDRPATYDDVGRLCRWDAVFPAQYLRRSRYERVLMLAIAGRALELDGKRYRPSGMRGWSHVVLRRLPDGQRRVAAVDDLVPHLERWTGS